MVFFWLFIFYVCLTIVQWWKTTRSGPVPQWKKIRFEIFGGHRHQPCRTSAECPGTDEVCFRDRCMSKMISGTVCDGVTGEWVLARDSTVACSCKRPRLVSQRHVGGSCDLDVACGPLGSLEGTFPDRLTCNCPFGYVSHLDDDGVPRCRSMRAIDSKKFLPCPENFAGVHEARKWFDDEAYVPDGVGCVPKPCSFDALTGKALRHNAFRKGWGCECNPRRGSVGAKIAGYPLADAPGYNACFNIFDVEPLHDHRGVRLLSYFYVFDKQPISFVQFSDLNDVEALARPFREIARRSGGRLQIHEDAWPHDAMQGVFRHSKNFKGRWRKCMPYNTALSYYRCNRILDYDRHVERCDRIASRLEKTRTFPEHNIETLLYMFPACYVGEDDAGANALYRDRFVLNPFQMTFPNVHSRFGNRYNGLSMTWIAEEGKWFLQFAGPPHDDFFKGVDLDAVPKFPSKVVERLEGFAGLDVGAPVVDPIRDFN